MIFRYLHKGVSSRFLWEIILEIPLLPLLP